MDIFIVTKHAHYYPEGGTFDWQLVTTDEDAARATFERIADPGDWDTFLIRASYRPGDNGTTYSVMNSN